MRVVVYAQDLSGRNDHGLYTKSDINQALSIFFRAGESDNFMDQEGQYPISKREAEEFFTQDGRVTFYNADGERVTIALDPSFP